MNEQFNRAMDRIRDEMAESTLPCVQAVGEMVTNHLRNHPEWAAAIAGADKIKTLKALYDSMEKQAKAKAKAGSYYMPPSEEAECIRAHYGITEDDAQAHAETDAPKPQRAVSGLDALLAGL